jgi:hypothetical protein
MSLSHITHVLIPCQSPLCHLIPIIIIVIHITDLIGIETARIIWIVLGQIGDAIRVAMSNGLPGIYWHN